MRRAVATSLVWAWDLAFALALAGAFAWAVYEAQVFPEGARLFPLAIALPALALALLQAALSVRARASAPAEEVADMADVPDIAGEDTLEGPERARRTAEITAWILGVFAAVFLLGFLLAVPLAAVAYLRIAAREGWLPSVAVAGLCWALVFGVFDRLLHVPLPPGVLLRLFGVE